MRLRSQSCFFRVFILNTTVAPSEALFLLPLWLQGLTLVLATKFNSQSSLHFGQNLLIGKSFSLLVLRDNLWLLTNLGCEIFLRHLFGLSP